MEMVYKQKYSTNGSAAWSTEMGLWASGQKIASFQRSQGKRLRRSKRKQLQQTDYTEKAENSHARSLQEYVYKENTMFQSHWTTVYPARVVNERTHIEQGMCAFVRLI